MSVLINDLYYGHTCECCGGFENAARQSVVFSPEALAKGLEAIYKGLNVRDEIEDHIFRETLRLFNEAASKGISESKWPDVPDEFINQLRTNNAIWSAFRVHRMQNDIASKLIDENGQLKKFDRWVEDIKGMTNHYVGPWLRTEYNTAVIRAHQAADWKHFEAEADVFQNVRWMPTTSPDQDPLHRQYWEKKLTLPINHPFWEKHRPGDRWNCKCTLQQTDDPVNDEVIRDFYPVPQQAGLDNNPADDGKIFSDSHPYITKAYAGAQTAVGAKLDIPFDREFATVDEAFDFIKEYIAEEVTLTIKKSQLKNLTPILNQVANRMREFGIPKFKNFGNPANKNAYASWDSTTNSFNIGQKLLNNPSSLWKAEMAWRKRGIKYSSIVSEDDVVRNTVDHEIGHKLMYQYGMKTDAINVQTIAGKTINGFNEMAEVLGYYAGTNVDEFFAEAFACYFGPNRNKMVETKKMIERLIAKVKPSSIKELPIRMPKKRQKTEAEKEAIRQRWQKRALEYRINGIRQLPAGDGQSKALTKAVADVEKDIRMNKSFETGVVIDTDGTILIDKRGKSYSVGFSEDEVKQMKDKIMTHNHPRGWKASPDRMAHIGSSFSDSDLVSAVYADILEVRAVTPLYTFSMKRPASGWGVSYQTVMDTYRQIDKAVQHELWQAVRAKRLKPEQASAIHSHLVNKRLAKQLGWEYSKAKTR